MIDKHRTLYFTDIVNRADRLDPRRTCSELLNKHPSTKSGYYYMNLQRKSSSPSAQIYCDMMSKNGIRVTVIGHNSESRAFVNGMNLQVLTKERLTMPFPQEMLLP